MRGLGALTGLGYLFGAVYPALQAGLSHNGLSARWYSVGKHSGCQKAGKSLFLLLSNDRDTFFTQGVFC
jgi:hypothetical protein